MTTKKVHKCEFCEKSGAVWTIEPVAEIFYGIVNWSYICTECYEAGVEYANSQL